jgi:hypothetical protein
MTASSRGFLPLEFYFKISVLSL